MDIEICKVPYKFLDNPLVIGGKAMEYYGLRKSGDDIDLILSERDFEALEKQMPQNAGQMDIDHCIRYRNFEMWKTIRNFGYEFYSKQAIPQNGFSVISVERLVWLKALYIKEEKSIRDLGFISDYVMRKQYKQYLKNITHKISLDNVSNNEVSKETYTFSKCVSSYQGTIYDYDRKIRLKPDQFRNMVTYFIDEIEKITNCRNMFVLISMSNSLNFMACFFGVLSADAIPIIVSKNLSSAELTAYSKKCNPNIILSDYHLKSNEKYFCVLDDSIYYSVLHEGVRYGTMLKEKYGVFILHPTSGTTGESQLCVRDEKGCIAEPLNHIATYSGEKITSMLCMLPLNHAYGFGSAFLLGMIESYDMYLISEFNPRKIIHVLEDEKIDYMPANPVVLDLLLRTKTKASFQVPHFIISAGSVLKSELVKRFYDRFGVYVKASYGSTETGEICLQRENGVYPEGCVGHHLKRTKVDILKMDEIGVLYVNNPSLMNGYLRPDFTVDSSLIGEDGFFPTKDIATQDSTGMITLCGRLNDVINIYGVKIVPREIEDIISQLPSVKEVYVYGKANDKGYEVINAIIDTTSSMEEILDFCRSKLNRQKIPQNIYLQPIPKSETGKILRNLLL
jgi:acyl-CoA synthetase (AMP-forming)/AMP-acid ligase II